MRPDFATAGGLRMTPPKPSAPPPSSPAPRGDDRLHRRLQQAATARPEGASHRGFLPQILARVDETVLPRRLVLLAEGETVAEFHLARRALLALRWRGQQWPSEDAITAKEAVPALVGLLRAMEQALPPDTTLTWQTAPSSLRPRATQCSAKTIAEALTPPPASQGPTILAAFRNIALASCQQASRDAPYRHSDPASVWAPALEATLAHTSHGTRKTNTGGALLPSRACLRFFALTDRHMMALVSQAEAQEALILTPAEATRLDRAWAEVLI